MGPSKPILACLLLVAVAASGCAANNGKTETGTSLGDVQDIKATSTTGGIHGFVVDQKIVPVKGASVTVTPTGKNVTTDAGGAFVIDGLPAGTYLVKATHPLYDTQQQTVDVQAGVVDPPDVKFQLSRVIFANPYIDTLKFDGFIVCSQDFSGSLFSEECGEGVGVPCQVPVEGCQRVGGQGNNQVEYDFLPSADNPKSIIVELNWEPTVGAATTGALWTIVATDFVCDPTCGGTEVMNYGGDKYEGDVFGNCATGPSYIRQDNYTQTLNLTAATKISTFTWACGKSSALPPDPVFGIQPGYDIELNQKFQEFVTLSYYLPLPEGWSFVKGDASPF